MLEIPTELFCACLWQTTSNTTSFKSSSHREYVYISGQGGERQAEEGWWKRDFTTSKATLVPNLKRTVEARFRYDLTELSTYRIAGKSIPVVQIFYSSNRVSRETQTTLVWCRNLWKSNRVHNVFVFFIEGMENSLGTFLHKISLLPASQEELACFRATRLSPLACTQCQQQHTSATILSQCLKVSLSPLENPNNTMLAWTPCHCIWRKAELASPHLSAAANTLQCTLAYIMGQLHRSHVLVPNQGTKTKPTRTK